jgi:NADH dehydrogenase
LLAAIPLAFPLAKPNARFQPVFVDDVVEAIVRCLRGGACSRRSYELGGPNTYTLRQVVEFVAAVTGRRRLIVGLPDLLSRLEALVMDFVPGRPFSTDNYHSLCVDSVCAQDGFASLRIRPQAMEGAARQFLGADEGNAHLSRNRMLAGRAGRAARAG